MRLTSLTELENLVRDRIRFGREDILTSFFLISWFIDWSAADVKMEIPVLVWSLKSSILSSTSLQRDKTFWGEVSAAVEQSRRKANMVAQGDGKFGPWGWPQGSSKPKKKWCFDDTLVLPQFFFLCEGKNWLVAETACFISNQIKTSSDRIRAYLTCIPYSLASWNFIQTHKTKALFL